jgi:hypothetical protein
MKIILLHFNSKVWIYHVFKPRTGNEYLYQNSNVNGVRIINLATTKFFFQGHDIPAPKYS